MRNIDDDEYYHDGSGDDNWNAGEAGGDAGNLPAPSPVPEYEAGHEPAYARLIREMRNGLPSGFAFDASRGLIMVEKDARPVCGPLRVVAMLRKPQHTVYHYLIEFANRENEVRELVFSAEELEKAPIHLPAGLAKDGMWIPGSKAHVIELVRQWPCKTFGTLLLQPGWGRAGSQPIYAQVSGTLFWPLGEPQPLARLSKPLRDEQVAGTFAGWRQEVARLALGNPSLIFALSLALAAPLLDLVKAQSIGANFYARTSRGKSTTLRVMGSVYSDPTVLPTWNGTRTSMELRAANANDGLMIIDEFQSNPDKEAVKMLMAIGNGLGWTRGTAKLVLADTPLWRLVTASASERSIRHYMKVNDIDLPGGAAVRMMDIPARRWTYGVFQTLHGHPTGQSFANALNDAARRHHGHAGPAFIFWILQHYAETHESLPTLIKTAAKRIKEHPSLSLVAAEIDRVLGAMAIVAVAGELATRAGILPWPAGTALEATTKIARIWANDHDAELSEDVRMVLEQIVEDLPTFVDLRNADQPLTKLRGWRDDCAVYLTPEYVKAITREKMMETLRALAEEGVLIPGTEAHSLMDRKTLPGAEGRIRVYHLSLPSICMHLGIDEA